MFVVTFINMFWNIITAFSNSFSIRLLLLVEETEEVDSSLFNLEWNCKTALVVVFNMLIIWVKSWFSLESPDGGVNSWCEPLVFIFGLFPPNFRWSEDKLLGLGGTTGLVIGVTQFDVSSELESSWGFPERFESLIKCYLHVSKNLPPIEVLRPCFLLIWLLFTFLVE